MKYEFEIGERPSAKWTSDKLRKYVSWASSEVNKRLLEYKAQVDIGTLKESALVEREIRRLQNVLSKSTKKGLFIGTGSEKRTKKELLFKARSLYQFTKWDIYTPQSMRELEERHEKAYNLFNLNYAEYGKTISREDYEELVTAFGILGDSIINQFGSGEIANIYSKASDEKKSNLVQIMLKIIKEQKGQGKTVEQMADLLAQEMLKTDKDDEK